MCFACNGVQPLHKPLTRFGAGSLSGAAASPHFQRISDVLTLRFDSQAWLRNVQNAAQSATRVDSRKLSERPEGQRLPANGAALTREFHCLRRYFLAARIKFFFIRRRNG
jgi:hypothetical protein